MSDVAEHDDEDVAAVAIVEKPKAPAKRRETVIVTSEAGHHAAMDLAQKALAKAERLEARLADKEPSAVAVAVSSKEAPKKTFVQDFLSAFMDDEDGEPEAEDESDA